MKKRILSLVLIVCLITTILIPITAFAAGNGLSTSATNVKQGETFTVTLQIPSIAEKMATVQFWITFDRTDFQVTSYVPPTVTGGERVYSTESEANAAGKITVSYSGAGGDNTVDLSSGYTLTATVKALDAATIGNHTFTLSSCKLEKLADDGYSVLDQTPSGLTNSANVTIYSELAGAQAVTGLTAPTKGTAPVTSVTAPTNTTAAVKWYVGTTEFTGSTFAANTAYTAKVTLTPNTGYKFASGATYTIDGTTVTAADGTGDAKILTKTFPATESRTITALTITKQPTTLTYSHGDTLNTAGMVVKATYDDGSEDAAFTGYTVSYSAGGSYLNKGETSVNIAAGSQTATVTGLNVGAKTLTITGITATNRKYESGNTTVTLSGGTLVGVVVGETVGFDLNATSATIASADVGTGKDVTAHIVLTGANKDNYTLTQPTGIKVNINPADNTVSAFTCANVEFGTAPSPSGATATNGVAAYTYSATQTGTYGAWDAANGVGTYYVKAAVAASGNYAAGEKIQSFQVTAKSLAAATFGTVSSQPYTGSAITPEPTVTLDSQLTKGSDFDYTYSNNTYVGTATVNVAGKNNYTGAATTGAAFTITAVTDPAVITGTASVTKGGKTVDLSANVTGAKGTVSYLLTSGSGSVDSTAGVYTSPAASGSATVQVTIADKDMGGSAAVEYTGKTANITITINDKATQSTLICVPNKTTVEYGKTLTLGSTGGSGSGTVTYSVVSHGKHLL
jgi:hypothetical protein